MCLCENMQIARRKDRFKQEPRGDRQQKNALCTDELPDIASAFGGDDPQSRNQERNAEGIIEMFHRVHECGADLGAMCRI